MADSHFDITQHPWSDPLTDQQTEALGLIELATSETRDFVHEWCVKQHGWRHQVGSPCETAMHDATYLRSDGTAWGHKPFFTMNWDLATYVLSATDLLAAVGALCTGGAYAGQTTIPCIRASFERSITLVWILNFDLDPRQMYARSVLERIGALDFAIPEAPATRRTELKAARKTTRRGLQDLFKNVEDTTKSGNVGDLTVADQIHESFTERGKELAGRALDGAGIAELYGVMSFFAHPNVVGDSMFRNNESTSAALLTADVEGVARATHNAMATLGTALEMLGEWMGWPSEPHDDWSRRAGDIWKKVHALSERSQQAED